MQAIKQFLGILFINLKRVYTTQLLVALACITFFSLLYMAGFTNFAYANILFFWCAAMRPSVERKNLQYILWSLRFAPLAFGITWLGFWAICSQCCHPEFGSGSMHIILLSFAVPLSIYTNFYVLDSGLRVHRLLYAPVGIVRMYIRTGLITIPLSIISVWMSAYVPIVILGMVIPVLIAVCSLAYYKTLYENFRVYYAEI